MISSAYAGALAAGRTHFNARMRAARSRDPALSPEVFLAFLAAAGPLVDAVAASAPGRLEAVVDSVYDAGLALSGRSPKLVEAWSTLMPHFAALIAGDPARVLGMLGNALVHLEAMPGTRLAQWLDELSALAPQVDSVDALAALGQIAAWRAGAAHFRAGALAAAATVPESLALGALHAPPGVALAPLLAQIAHDPWWQGADVHARRQRECGSFAGFGGPFGAPPELKPDGDGFLVRSAGRAFYLMADAYGASLQAATAGEFDAAASDRVAHPIDALDLDLPDAGLRVCANAHTLAITSPFTHAIHLVARA